MGKFQIDCASYRGHAPPQPQDVVFLDYVKHCTEHWMLRRAGIMMQISTCLFEFAFTYLEIVNGHQSYFR